MATMREMMRLVEASPPSHGSEGMPDTLYHGTSLQNYLDIRACDCFEPDAEGVGRIGFSTTENEAVAIRFARMKASIDRWGVVLTLDANALAARYQIIAYNDDDEHDTLADHYEWEWVVATAATIPKATSYITGVQVIDMQGDPNHLQPWDEKLHGFDHRAAEEAAQQSKSQGIETLRQRYTKQQAQAALVTAGMKVHTDRSRKQIIDLVHALDDQKLYELLWSYLKRIET